MFPGKFKQIVIERIQALSQVPEAAAMTIAFESLLFLLSIYLKTQIKMTEATVNHQHDYLSPHNFHE
jgi:hypothetical protein